MPDQLVRRQPKPVRELDQAYLDFVRSKPCCLIGYGTTDGERLTWRGAHLRAHICEGKVEAHHVSPRNGTKGTGSKVSDKRAVPVCLAGHRAAEKHAASWLSFFNGIIDRLNREYNATHPAKRTRERKPSVKVGLGVRNCPACHGEHFYPTKDFRQVTGYLCKVKNVWIDFSEVSA